MKNPSKKSATEIRKRFSSISIKKGFISILFLAILTVAGFLVAKSELNLSSTWKGLLSSYIFYLIPFFLVIWAFRSVNHPIISIFKGDSDKVSQVLMVVPLITISIGITWLIILGLNFISLGAAESYLNWLYSIQIFKVGPETSLLHYVLFFGVVAILGPVVEEIIFRGIMIERLGTKYNYRWAVIISSVIFAILHLSPIGAFIFGVALSLVYLKTESLMIPILIHIANNTIAVFLMIADKKYAFDYASWKTVEPYISNAWVGIFLFITGIVWLGWYIKNNWQFVIDNQPFKIEAEKN